MKHLMFSVASLYAMAAMAPEGVSSAVGLGLSGKVVHVHKKDAEGMLAIDGYTGQVIPGQHDKPEWAQEAGLVQAMLAERHIFYSARLGEQNYTDEMRNPEVMAFEDLGWLALHTDPAHGEDDDEYVIEASEEHRMDVLASALGIDRESGEIKGVLAETEVASDQTRSAEELAQLQEAQAGRFAATGTGE